MSSSDHGMGSEKEEAVTSTKQDEEQEVEAIPGSSPEGVFSNEEGNMFEHIEHAPHHIPLQVEELKHGEEIVEEQGDALVQEGDIGDDGQHYVQISQEDLYEAGFEYADFANLTEEQINMVLAISQQRHANLNREGGVEESGHHHIIHQNIVDNHFEEGEDAAAHGNEFDGDDGRAHMAENSVQIILTNDGGVSITDTKQQQYYIPPNTIHNLNIDLNALSTEHVNQLLQLAIPSMKESNAKNDEGSYIREEIDQTPSTSYHQHQHHQDQVETEKGPRIPEIGETVQIRTSDGRLQDAVVKYFRGSSEFKVQFMHGGFAYATIDQMHIPQRTRGDHDNYQCSAPMLIRRSDVAQKRPANTSDDLCPPILKRSYHLAPIVDGPHVIPTPNFCCPICDKKVFQKEPSYIVIRLPACDSCTREKIIVLDEQNS
ncbi:hypothetical protein CAEBREN_00976 [Caenorhabditis brenneri]|uniref:Uncharacterized protein n=1 Tax=Caenorhabditis brenneri TaxID=135651 RepID=G0MVI8_CAEBE|nr:hypothetical protein CAEBREN_00976 [Caenorhabditis brenneri]